jgi:peptidoglycan hydrolase-like protein with peptidoglycan-binding domain
MSPAVGVHVTRVVLPAQPGLSSAASPTTTLRVDPRNLSDGMTGADVLALQKLLLAQHYDPGPLNSRFGYDTHHAVMTFQKLQRLPATGSWGGAERLRSTRPVAYKVRYPKAGRAVEIDVTRQILVLSEGGVVRRIIDVSTGSGRVYYQEGARNIAHTPRGRFSVFYKINGTRISKLGELYKPSYFYQGYAVHGSASVPNYPASHGCVRITNPNADRIFPLLTVGTPVTVFDE